MGRPSKLSEAQWSEVKRRMLAGETAASLAREFGVSKATIGERVSKRLETVRTVAQGMIDAEVSLRALPISEQLIAVRLADELRAISAHLAGAAKFSAATAHRLAGIAHAEVQKIDDADPLSEENVGAMKNVAVLTKMANDASVIPLNLVSANKEVVKQINDKENAAEEIQASVRPRISREQWLVEHGLS